MISGLYLWDDSNYPPKEILRLTVVILSVHDIIKRLNTVH